jgi:hypothetical protein
MTQPVIFQIYFSPVFGSLALCELKGDWLMYRTITVGSCVSVQGLLVKTLSDGKMVIKVDERLFVGYPVQSVRAN